MSFDPRPGVSYNAGVSAAEYDEGLRSYMLGVYNYMASAVALSGLTAALVASSPTALALIFGTPLKWVLMFAPLVFVFMFAARIHKMSPNAAQGAFWAFAVVMGLSLSSIFIAFSGADIARAFFGAAAGFAAMSVYGYTTKKSLSGWGSFLFIGVIGLIIASVINIFVGSTMMQFVISSGMIIVFAGLTAYDTQNIKNGYDLVAGDQAAAKKSAIFGALSLYINFINIFIALLQLIGLFGGDD